MKFETIALHTSSYPHSFCGDISKILSSYIVTSLDHAKTLDAEAILIADKISLKLLIDLYTSEDNSTKKHASGMTLSAQTADEAIVGINSRLRVEFEGSVIDARKFKKEEAAVAKLSLMSEAAAVQQAKSVLMMMLEKFPMTSIEEAVGSVVKANPAIERSWAEGFASWCVENKRKKLAAPRELTMTSASVESVEIDKMLCGGIFIDKRPTGAGKTEFAERLVREALARDERVIYITSRIAIADSHMTFIPNYRKLEFGQESSINGLSIVVNSLIKPRFADFFATRDKKILVVLEEGSQILDHIATGTCKDEVAVYKKLQEICASAHTLLVTDADANNMTLDFVKSAKPNSEVTFISKEADFSSKTLTMMSYDQAIGEIDVEVQSKKVMISTDSRTQVDKLAEHFSKNFPLLRVLKVHKDNIGDTAQQEFLKNPNAEAMKYDVIAYSPAITSSLSITTDEFKVHFGLYSGVITSEKAIQQLRRNRPCSDFRVGVQSKSRKIDGVDNLLHSKPTSFDRFVAEVTAAENYNCNNIISAIYHSAVRATFTVKVSKKLEMEEAGKVSSRTATKLETEKYIETMLATKPAAKRNNVEGCQLRSDQEERARIESATGKRDLTEQDIKDYRRGQLGIEVANLEILRSTVEECRAKDNREFSVSAAKKRRFVEQNAAYNLIFSTLGIDTKTFEGTFTATESADLLKKLMENRKSFNLLRFGVKLDKTLPAVSTRKVKSILKEFGLAVEDKKSSGAGRTRIFSIKLSPR